MKAPKDDQRSVERSMGWKEGEFMARMQHSGGRFKASIKEAHLQMLSLK